MTDDARFLTRTFSLGGAVLILVGAVVAEAALQRDNVTGVVLGVIGVLGAGVGVVVLGVHLATSGDAARR